MHEFGHRLIGLLRRQGCPAGAAARLIQETDDHRACLEAEGIRNGLTPAEALVFAEQRLGSAEVIAERFIRMRRGRDWWGRHPVLLFGLLPLVLFLLGFAAAILVVGSFGAAQGWWKDPASMGPGTWMGLTLLVPLFHFSLLLAIPAVACRLAGSYCYGWAWTLLACLILTLHASFHFVAVEFPLPLAAGHITWGYGFSNDLAHHLSKGLPPLLPFAFHLVRHWLRSRMNLSPDLNPLAS